MVHWTPTDPLATNRFHWSDNFSTCSRVRKKFVVVDWWPKESVPLDSNGSIGNEKFPLE